MPALHRILLPVVLLLSAAACDNVGRAFDRDLGGSDPNPTPGESIIQVVPDGGDSREGRPKVRAAFPADGGWPTTVPIVVEFSESLNEASIEPSSPTATDAKVILRVRGATQVLPCQYDFVANGRVLVMRPLTELSNAQTPTYEVVLLPGGRDVDGLRFSVPTDGTVLTSFQVNQDASFKDGRILTTYPRDNSREATRETAYWVFFDRPANPNSILLSTTSLRLRRRGGPDLVGKRELPLSVATIDDPRIVRFTPDDLLAGSTTHELIVDATITFGSDGTLDFRGRTPFAVFETIGPAAPTAVAIGNTTSGFPNKVNRANLGTVVLQVTTTSDTQPGDGVRARIYGGDATTAATSDVAFVEGTATVPGLGVQTISVDFAGKLGSLTSPKFDDGSLTIAAQLVRGSQQSGFSQSDSGDAPVFDITPPTLVRAGPPASPDGADIVTDQEAVAFFGRANEGIAEASLTDGVSPAVELFASGNDGRFLMKPILLGRLPTVGALAATRSYTLTLTDRAGNLATAPATGRIVQRGLLTGTVATELTVEVFDNTTLLPLANATVVVEPDVPTVPPTNPIVRTTNAAGAATFTNLTAPRHTITIVRAGYHLQSVYNTNAAFASLPLRPLVNPAATLSGNALFEPAPGTTVAVGCSGFDDPTQVDVRTTNAAPSSIPATPIVPNRPTMLTAFGGQFEPTATPTFSLQAIQMLGATTTVATAPPVSPAAGETLTTNLALVTPVPLQFGGLVGSYTQDLGTATGLDLANLVNGRPTVRVTTSMVGFTGQVLAGVGFARLTTGTTFETNVNFSLPAFAQLTAFTPVGWVLTDARDLNGRISRRRDLISNFAQGTIAPNGLAAPAIPSIALPPTPAAAVPAVIFDDVLDPANGGVCLYELTAEDLAGRKWFVLAADTDAVGGTDTIQLPDLAAAGVTGLAAGTWTMQVEGRLFISLTSAAANDLVLTERLRTEVLLARSSRVPFTVP